MLATAWPSCSSLQPWTAPQHELVAFRVDVLDHRAVLHVEHGAHGRHGLAHQFVKLRAGQRAAAQVGDGFLLPRARLNLLVGAGEFGGAVVHAAFEVAAGFLQFAAGLRALGDVVAQTEKTGTISGGDGRGVDLHGPGDAAGIDELDFQVAQRAFVGEAAGVGRAEAQAVARGGPIERVAAEDVFERGVGR